MKRSLISFLFIHQPDHTPYIVKRQRGSSSAISIWLILSLITSFLWLSTPAHVQAEALSIPCNVTNLRDAISQANESDGPDTLELASNCVYMLFTPVAEQDGYGPNGMPIIDSEITIQGSSSTIARSPQPGVTDFRIFELTEDANLTLYDLTVSGGSLTDPHTATTGGGIYSNGGRLTLSNVVLSNNKAGDAGGICATGESTITIIHSIITGNTSTSSQSTGGAIQNNGELSITDTVISANSANEGGGIYTKTNVSITNTTITGNSSVDGAGIYNDGGIVNMSNTTIYANSATGSGGGIFSSASLTVINSTFYKNSAASGGGIYNLGNENAATLKNTIVASSNGGSNCHGSFSSSSTHNLRWPSSDSTCVGTFGDPKLNTLGKYGGPTPTLSLQTGSKATDTADDNVCSASPVNNTDQRGELRPFGTHCDIGAFEGTIDVKYTYLPSLLK